MTWYSKWLITMVIGFDPKTWGNVGPLPNDHSWLINRGDPKYLRQVLGAHPPSTPCNFEHGS